MSKSNGSGVMAIGPEVTNGGELTIDLSVPYTVDVRIQGTADLLFHRWNCEAVEEKSKAAKGSKAKKTDNIESYVYRNDAGELCLPGEYLRQSVIHAAKFRQDPRSPRKSAMDLFKAGIVSLTSLAAICRGLPSQVSAGSGMARLGTPVKGWDYEHKCRVVVQRNGITRVRPALKEGWVTTIQLMITTPEYISPMILQDVINAAGRLVGVGDFRPTYGRFNVTSFDVGMNG